MVKIKHILASILMPLFGLQACQKNTESAAPVEKPPSLEELVESGVLSR